METVSHALLDCSTNVSSYVSPYLQEYKAANQRRGMWNNLNLKANWEVTWNPPPPRGLKLNVDATIDNQKVMVGLAGVVKNDNQTVIAGYKSLGLSCLSNVFKCVNTSLVLFPRISLSYVPREAKA
uniref:RNase H type-1 domain-containing protein n=1 Tax=Cannabis sativa TaxID=3483 RepID=A0A803P4V6_CANSA